MRHACTYLACWLLLLLSDSVGESQSAAAKLMTAALSCWMHAAVLPVTHEPVIPVSGPHAVRIGPGRRALLLRVARCSGPGLCSGVQLGQGLTRWPRTPPSTPRPAETSAAAPRIYAVGKLEKLHVVAGSTASHRLGEVAADNRADIATGIDSVWGSVGGWCWCRSDPTSAVQFSPA
jgi:hypothetical protein